MLTTIQAIKTIGILGSQDGKPILQLVCNFMISNIIDKPISLANAKLNGIKGDQTFVTISVKDINSKYSGSYDIPPKQQTSVSICFIMHPKKMPESKESIHLKIEIIDQFGNKHRVKDVIFRHA